MNLQHTERLTIRPLAAAADAAFMLGLLNDPSWLHFIGDRGVKTLADAQAYIASGPVAMYARLGHGFCVVETRRNAEPIGIALAAAPEADTQLKPKTRLTSSRRSIKALQD